MKYLITKATSRTEVVESTYNEVIVSDLVPKDFRFSLTIKKSWRSLVHEVGPESLRHDGAVVLFESSPVTRSINPGDGLPIISVSVFSIPKEIDGYGWYRIWKSINNFVEIEFRTAPSHYGTTVDAVVYSIVNGRKITQRVATFKDGGRIFLVQCSCEDATYASNAESFLLAIGRFRLLSPSREIFAERFKWESVAIGSDHIKFLTPSSWASREATDWPAGGGGIVVDNFYGQEICGFIIVATTPSYGDLESIENLTKLKLSAQGVHIDRPQKFHWPNFDNSNELDLRISGAVHGGRRKSVILSRRKLGGHGVLMLLVSPTESESVEAWCVNRRAFEIAVTSVQMAPSS